MLRTHVILAVFLAFSLSACSSSNDVQKDLGTNDAVVGETGADTISPTPDGEPETDGPEIDAPIADGPIADSAKDATPPPNDNGIPSPDGPLLDVTPLPDGIMSDALFKQFCDDIETAYKLAVKSAKKCSQMLPIIQCQMVVDDRLTCPCQTHVEQSNTAPIQTMASLKNQWTNLNCGAGIDCTSSDIPPCPSLGTGTCTSTGLIGDECQDVP
ncbi:MAG: hypothetical protein V1754_09225 [Pseudomonadota bacterium]